MRDGQCAARKRKAWNLWLTANLDLLGYGNKFDGESDRSQANIRHFDFSGPMGGRPIIKRVRPYLASKMQALETLRHRLSISTSSIVDPLNNDLCKSATVFLHKLSMTTRT